MYVSNFEPWPRQLDRKLDSYLTGYSTATRQDRSTANRQLLDRPRQNVTGHVFVYRWYISMCCQVGTLVCVLYDQDHNRQVRLRGTWALGSFCESGFGVLSDHGVFTSCSSLSSRDTRASLARGIAAVPGPADRPAIQNPPDCMCRGVKLSSSTARQLDRQLDRARQASTRSTSKTGI